MNFFDLHHQTALITGASSGLREEVARCLSRAGACMILAARSFEKLEVLAQELKDAFPLHFIAEPSDLDETLFYLASNKASPYVTGSIISVDG